MVFALGIHCPEKNPSIPFFLIEIRRRVLIASYTIDKTLATLLGRPPRIAWQYCDIQSPLDLDYEEIFRASDEQRHDKLLEKIGPDGWYIEGRMTAGSKARLYAMFAPIREKILALSLSPHPGDVAQKIS
jgi:chromatin structure-remodeling complex subunit RSC3/30